MLSISAAACGGMSFALDPVFLRNRPDQQIGEEADNEQSGHDAQNDRIGFLFENVLSKSDFTQSCLPV